MRNRALVWERHHGHWDRVHGPVWSEDAHMLAALIREPISDDDDPQDAKVFELQLSGTVADMTSITFAALRLRSHVTIRGRPVYVDRRIDASTIRIYDDATIAYETVVAPLEANNG